MFVLPVSKDDPVTNTPWVVFGLILSNALVFVVTSYPAISPETLFKQYGFVPAQPRAVALFSAMFLHAGFWHLLGNMWFLWMFGNRVENMFRPWLFSLVYLLSGLGGHYLHYAFNATSEVPCVGASGAISGIAGSYLVLFPKSKFDLVIALRMATLKTIRTRADVAIGAWIAEQVALGLIAQAAPVFSVAFWAHVGGFGTGALGALLFAIFVSGRKRRTRERAEPGLMHDPSNKEDSHFTMLKL